jgi:hypothetical protein
MTGVFQGIRHGALAMIGPLALAIASSAMTEEAKPQQTKGVSVGSTSMLPGQ